MVLLARGQFALGVPDPWLAIFDVLLPAAALAVALVAAFWFGRADAEIGDGDIRRLRLCLAAGAVAFVLHNMVTYSLWTAGPAMLFWVAAGAAMGQGWTHPRRLPRAAGVGGTALAGAAMIAVAVCLSLPLARQYVTTQHVARAIERGDAGGAAFWAQRAAHNADAAMLAAKLSPLGPEGRLLGAEHWAAEAVRLDPANSETWRLLAEVRWRKARERSSDVTMSQVVEAYGEAVARDVANARLRLAYAEALLEAGRPADAAAQLDEAERIDEALRAFDPDSHKLFGPMERATLKRLRAAASGSAAARARVSSV
jgi:tetratricopeptide (TPR) repeat protein